MTNPFPWFRMWNEMPNDRKLIRAAIQAQVPKALAIGVWTTILCLASDSPERGVLLLAEGMPLTMDEIILAAGLPTEDFTRLLSAFEQLGMIEWHDGVLAVTHWNGRQYASDHSTPRVQEHRKRKQAMLQSTVTETPSCNVTETLQDRFCNAPESESESDLESEGPPRGARKKPRAPSPPLPSQILVFREAMGGRRLPHKATWPMITLAIEDNEPALTTWREVVSAWIASGYNPNNVKGMLDWFKNGIPENKRGDTHGINRGSNGTSQPIRANLPSLEDANWVRERKGLPLLTPEQYAEIERRMSNVSGSGVPG